MREIWDHLFGYALLKIERANQHIADIEKRLRASSDRYGPSLHMNAKTGEQFLYYRLEDRYLRSDLALIVGDAIHNLRCALDIAWCETVRRHKPDGCGKFTMFPIDPKGLRQRLEGVLASAQIPNSSSIYTLMVDRLKPYKGGDADILALHALDIDDKHRLLIPVIAVTGVMGVELKNEDGSVDVLDITITRPNSYRRIVGLETKLQHHGELIFHVTFGKGTPFENLEITPTLLRLSQKVKWIVRAFQRLTC